MIAGQGHGLCQFYNRGINLDLYFFVFKNPKIELFDSIVCLGV